MRLAGTVMVAWRIGHTSRSRAKCSPIRPFRTTA